MGASAARMNPAGHQLFTRAAFASDQDSGIGWCHPFDNVLQREDFRVLPEEDGRLRGGSCTAETVALQGFVDYQQQFVRLEWFREVIKSAEFHRLDRGGNGGVAC